MELFSAFSEAFSASFFSSTFFSVVLGVISYVFTAIALYTIAKRRGIHHAWMAWFPLLNCWILGCIADQYQYLVRGKNTNRRVIMLVVQIITLILCIVCIASIVGIGVGVFESVASSSGGLDEDAIVGQAVGAGMIFILTLIPIVGLSITYQVFRFIALYDVFRSCVAKDATVYLVLSIFIRVTEPFFLFACRNKDAGMPPRRVP